MKQFFTLLFVLFVIGAKAQIVNIPDANFKSFLLNYFPRIDTNFDNEIDVNEAAAFNINPFYINCKCNSIKYTWPYSIIWPDKYKCQV